LVFYHQLLYLNLSPIRIQMQSSKITKINKPCKKIDRVKITISKYLMLICGKHNVQLKMHLINNIRIVYPVYILRLVWIVIHKILIESFRENYMNAH